MSERRPPVPLLFAVTLVGILANTTITPNIPDILADLGRTDASAGLLVASGPLPAVVVAPIIGILADRFGRKRVLVPCLVLFGVGALAGSVAPTFCTLVAARIFQGLGGAGLINLAVVLIGDHWTGLDRVRLIGRNSAVLTAALAVFPSVSGFVAEFTSWRVSIALGALAFPIALVALRWLPDRRPTDRRTLADQLSQAAIVVRQPVLLFTFASGFVLFVVIFWVFLTTLPVHLKDEFGLGPGGRGLVLSAPAVGATLVAFNLARIRAVFSLRPVLTVCSFFIAAAALALAFAPSLTLVVVAMLLYGLGDGAVIPALQEVATVVPPPEQRASVLAIWVAAIRLGQAVGPIAAAALFAATSTSFTLATGAVLLTVVGVLYLVGPIDERVVAESEGRAMGPRIRETR